LPRWGVIVTNLRDPTGGIVRFYTGRGTAAPWRKDGQYALHWTRCSCHTCIANQVRLALFMLPDTLGNFLCRLAVPAAVKDRSLRRVQVQPITMGGRLVRHARRVVFPLAAVAVPRGLFQGGAHPHSRAYTGARFVTWRGGLMCTAGPGETGRPMGACAHADAHERRSQR
jgi:Transposase DDE domain group 1